MNKLYTLIVWHNNTAPALNEDNLNAMSEALDAIDTRVVEIAGDVIEVVPQIQDYLAQAQALEEALELLSRNPPYIGANGNWYVFNTETSQYEDSGVDASITVSIADITMLATDADPYVTNSGTNTDPVFHLFIPRGATGNGIDRIQKTSSSGLVDTYTIYFTDGTTTTYTVTNGQSGSGTGDMNESDYDPSGTVKTEGGIPNYVTKNAVSALGQSASQPIEGKIQIKWVKNSQDNNLVIDIPGWNALVGQKSSVVSAAVGATSVSFTNPFNSTNIAVDPYSENSSGTPISIISQTVTTSTIVLNFASLSEATNFYVQVKSLS